MSRALIRAPWALWLSILAAASCQVTFPRQACTRDGECPTGEVCFVDDLCLPPAVALRRGGDLGTACRVEAGLEVGCEGALVCRMGRCVGSGGRLSCAGPSSGAPLFGGVSGASPDGPDAVVVKWSPAADETVHAEMTYLVYMSTREDGFDLSAPVATLVGQAQHRQTGLNEGTVYYFLVRSRDADGQSDCNQKVVSAAPRGLGACVDYARDVKPILDGSCVRCHSGASAPQDLRLDSYQGVLQGGRSGNEVVKCQPGSSLLFLKVSLDSPPVGARMPFDGPPYLSAFQIDTLRGWLAGGAIASCEAPSQLCNDTAPPSFAGLTSAQLQPSGVAAKLCWSAASDAVTAAGELVYDLFQATSPGAQAFNQLPRLTSPKGASCVEVDGLMPGQEYCWVVRARDEAGNRDANTQERCLTTPAASCVDFATMVQPIFRAECVHCHGGANPPRGLKLDSYAGVKAGGLSGNEVQACRPQESLLYMKISSDTPPVGARMPLDGPPYLSANEIALVRRWIEEGARQSCSEADPCADSTTPSFLGLTGATAKNPTAAELCWTAGSDDLTPAANLLYDVYWASVSGGQLFSSPPGLTSPAGASCVTAQALSPGDRYCFVVRARDAAGNRDSNTQERCLTMPPLPAGCLDYATLIQPLFDQHCTRCHAGPLAPQGLELDSYPHAIAGSVRRSEIDACNSAGSLLSMKISANPPLGKRMPFDGPPYLSPAQVAMVNQWIDNGATRSCSEPQSCADTQPPSFAGINSAAAVDLTTIRVCWPQATDNVTGASAIRYDIYEATSPGSELYGEPAQHSAVDQLCRDVKVGPGTYLCFVVRARDLAGNVSPNTQEKCATTAASGCALEYDDVRPILASRCVHCHRGANPPRFLDCSSYGGVLAGGAVRGEVRGCDPNASLLLSKISGAVCGRRMPFDGPPYLAPSQLSVFQQWVASGARERCSSPSPCSDTTHPTFFGASSAQAMGPATARVCWNPASDDTSPASAISYEVFEAAAPGGERFLSPASYAAPAGSSCLEIPVPPDQTSCFVVRARDLRGNRDGNSVERCVRPPAACVDYSSRLQPVFQARCTHCHSGPGAPRGIRWDSYSNTMANQGEVEACNPDGSKLTRVAERCEMPLDTSPGVCATPACLTPSQQRLFRSWIDQGASPGCPAAGCP